MIALDDGSADRTPSILHDHHLVATLLSSPLRESYKNWDDRANRQRLLDAAAELAPDWIVWMDADERIPPDDAAALRRFLETDALPGCAFGLRHHRMWMAPGAVEATCDPEFTTAFRVFSYVPGDELPPRRLHFDPIPGRIPRNAYLQTTIRLQHYGAATKKRLRARLSKYSEADPDGMYGDFRGLAALPAPGRLVPWSPRRQGIPVLAAEPASLAGSNGKRTLAQPRPRSRLVCLLPARNCESDLPGYFECVRRFADAVVALDDGSTDGTRAMLEAHPLVSRLLINEPRAGYHGWDDATNRNRLLRAAGELEPDWIVSLDADERIDAEDAAALRTFVDDEAVPGHAYGMRVFRMIGDPGGYDRADLWVYRLFAFEPGQSFSGEFLHGVPVPISISRDRWVRTTIRIRHLAGLTDVQRRRRFQKYMEADPDNRGQRSYEHLLEPPGIVRPWERRPPGAKTLPDHGLAGSHSDLETAARRLELDAPVLSAIVISRNDEDRIERVVRAVVEQRCPVEFEVIVVTSGNDRTAAIVRERFPQVRLIELPHPALPGEARNAGLRLARGDYISFPGSHVELPQGSLGARVAAHDLGHAMVTGTLLNGTDTPAGWANYFLDHAYSLPGRPSGALSGPPAHCSYMREPLLEVGGFPERLRAGEDTVVNAELHRRGYRAYRSAEITLVHRSRCEHPVQLVRHHFGRGRARGRILLARSRHGGPLVTAEMLRRDMLVYAQHRVTATAAAVHTWADPPVAAKFRRVAPLVAAAAAADVLGTWVELLRPRRGALRELFARRGLTLLVDGDGPLDAACVAHFDLVARQARIVELPPELPDGILDRCGLRIDERATVTGGPDTDAILRLLRARGVAPVRPDDLRRVRLPLGLVRELETTDTADDRVHRTVLHAALTGALGLDEGELTAGMERSGPSPSFRFEDFACPDGTAVPVDCRDAVAALCRNHLEPMRARFGEATIHSGYRTEAHNERIGGTVFSYHLYDLRPGRAAADVEFERGAPADWAGCAIALGVGGVGRHDELGFVHIDTRDEPRRWGDS